MQTAYDLIWLAAKRTPHQLALVDDRTEGKLTDRELLDEVWGYNAGVTTHTLETHIYRLRQKIEPDPANVQMLVTEPGGYRLIR